MALKLVGLQSDRAEMEHAISTILLKSRGEADDGKLVEELIAQVKDKIGFQLDPASILVYRTSDQKHMRIDISLKYPLRLPLVDVGWDLDLEVSKSENVGVRIRY
jgi:hypothetical protein